MSAVKLLCLFKKTTEFCFLWFGKRKVAGQEFGYMNRIFDDSFIEGLQILPLKSGKRRKAVGPLNVKGLGRETAGAGLR